MSVDILYSFIFKGMLTEEVLDRSGRVKKYRNHNEQFKKIHESLGIDELEDEFVTLAQKMSIVYTAICAFENTVRAFISKKLLEVKGEDWWNKSVSEKNKDKSGEQTQRRKQD